MKFSQIKNKLASTKATLTNLQQKQIKGGNGTPTDDTTNGIGSVDTVDI